MAAIPGQGSFAHLPPEPRNMIYIEYVTIKGGYLFNPETRKLEPNNDNPRDHTHPFALQYTCKTIAIEMRGLALKQNSITIYFPCKEMRKRWYFLERLDSCYMYAQSGYAFHRLPRELNMRLVDVLKQTANARMHMPGYLTNEELTCLFTEEDS